MNKVTNYQVPQSRCLKCGKLLDGATSAEPERSPQEGDMSVCIYCGHVAVYKADLTLRYMTREELDNLKANHPKTWREIQRTSRAIKESLYRRNSRLN